MTSEPLTATEIEQNWRDLPNRYPELIRLHEKAQAELFGPMIEKVLDIMKRDSFISKGGGVGEGTPVGD